MNDRLRWKLIAFLFVVVSWSLFDFPRSFNLESFAFQDSRARWLYTGITRAAKRLSVVV